MSEYEFNQLVRSGEFPPPIKLSKTVRVWHVDDLGYYVWGCQIRSRGERNFDETNAAVKTAQEFAIARDGKTGFVYFVRGGDAVKIGYATDVNKRLDALQTSFPLVLDLVFFFEGTHKKERSLHKQFKHLRIRPDGEWFRWCDEIAEFIDKLRLEIVTQ